VYGYARGAPQSEVDPTGEYAQALGGAVIFGGGNLAYQLYNNGGNLQCVNVGDVINWAFAGSGVSGLVSGLGRNTLGSFWLNEAGALRIYGPSGKFLRHFVDHASKKRAKDAARNAGNNAPVQHASPANGKPHFHPLKNGKKQRVHHNY
jgi:hypothetical protein